MKVSHKTAPSRQGGLQEPEAHRSHVQNLVGIDGQQRGGATKQHGEHVQADDSQDDFIFGKNETKPVSNVLNDIFSRDVIT